MSRSGSKNVRICEPTQQQVADPTNPQSVRQRQAQIVWPNHQLRIDSPNKFGNCLNFVPSLPSCIYRLYQHSMTLVLQNCIQNLHAVQPTPTHPPNSSLRQLRGVASQTGPWLTRPPCDTKSENSSFHHHGIIPLNIQCYPRLRTGHRYSKPFAQEKCSPPGPQISPALSRDGARLVEYAG